MAAGNCLDAELGAGAGREGHHFVGEMDRGLGLSFKAEGPQAGDYDILQVGLA